MTSSNLHLKDHCACNREKVLRGQKWVWGKEWIFQCSARKEVAYSTMCAWRKCSKGTIYIDLRSKIKRQATGLCQPQRTRGTVYQSLVRVRIIGVGPTERAGGRDNILIFPFPKATLLPVAPQPGPPGRRKSRSRQSMAGKGQDRSRERESQAQMADRFLKLSTFKDGEKWTVQRDISEAKSIGFAEELLEEVRKRRRQGFALILPGHWWCSEIHTNALHKDDTSGSKGSLWWNEEWVHLSLHAEF